MRVEDIMEKRFASFQTDDKIDYMLEALSERGEACALVFEKDELVGVVSYSDFAKFFMPREGAGFPFYGQQKAADGGIMAASILRKPPLTLSPDQPVSLALSRIVSTQDNVPVMKGRKVVGVVRPQSVIEFFLAERAKDEAAAKAKAAPKAKDELGVENSTAIDRMLEIVRREGEATPKSLARELKITEATAEDMAKLLGKHKLVEISYSFLTGMVIRRLEHGSR